MLLIAHVILGLIATTSALGTIIKASRNHRVSGIKNLALVGTTLTVVSGVMMIFDGSPAARVCVEAVLLVSLTALAVSYARRFETA